MDFLMRQDEHVSQYYTQTEFHVVQYKIQELLKPTNKVKIATDGGAIPLKGSLIWDL